MTPNQSRNKARQLIKSIPRFANLPSKWVVHHIDHDPFNNDLDNLAVMSKSTHYRMHPRYVLKKYGGRRSLIDSSKDLERLLIVYNFNL